MSEFKKVATLSDLEEGVITAVRVGDQSIALYKIGEEVFATTDDCTHDVCSLEDFGKIEGETVICTCHGAKFKIKTGEVTLTPALAPLKTYKTKVDGDDVLVEV